MADKEYIERGALAKWCRDTAKVQTTPVGKAYCHDFFIAVHNTPAADVVEVRRGEWEEYQIPNIICCSECDWGTGVENKHQFKFCPNCGADMRGNNDDSRKEN